MTLPRWLGMSPDGQRVVLERFGGAFRLPRAGAQATLEERPQPRRAAVLDVETTGLDHAVDEVIEVGLRTFTWDGRSGNLLAIGPHYSGLQQPTGPLSPEVARLTGLSDDALRGQRIDWAQVGALLADVELVIAHNAAFDRPFVDGHLGERDQIWACSLQQIDWRGLGYPVARLEVLALYHGFFVDAHRALEDADALLHLLSHTSPDTDQGYLLGLAAAARRPSVDFQATGAPFETKDLLKARRYRWQADQRVWQREVDALEADEEREWLRSHIYRGQTRWRERVVRPEARFRRA